MPVIFLNLNREFKTRTKTTTIRTTIIITNKNKNKKQFPAEEVTQDEEGPLVDEFGHLRTAG